MNNPTEPFPVEPIAFEELSPIAGHAAIQGESPIDEVDVTFDWKHHLDGSISDFRVTRGVFRYPELKPLPRWKRFLARLLLGNGWVHFRYVNGEIHYPQPPSRWRRFLEHHLRPEGWGRLTVNGKGFHFEPARPAPSPMDDGMLDR